MAHSREFIQQFCEKAKELKRTHLVPDMVLSIIHPSGNVVLTSGSNANESTLFPIGSMSKAFAATLVGILVDKGLIDWKDSIHKFVNIRLPNAIDLTIHQLLSHLNPFPEHALTQASELGFSRQELLMKLRYVKIHESFKFSYQNVLFSLIADIVERVTGQHYEDYLKQEILTPLGMSTTTAEEKAYLASNNRASSHILQGDKVTIIEHSPYWHLMGPPSCIASSITDLTHWLKFNLQLEHVSLISKNSLNKIQTPLKDSRPPYAMGWWHADQQGKVLCHTGSVTGFESAIAIFPAANIGIAVCANLSGDYLVYQLVNDFFQQVLNDNTFGCTSVLGLQMTLTRPKLSLDKFIGDFYHPILEKIKVSLKENELCIEVGKNKTTATLSPISLLASHSKITPALSELAPHHCFQISWKNGMEAAGKVYYDEDKIAFAEDRNGNIDAVLLYAEAISSSPLICKRPTAPSRFWRPASVEPSSRDTDQMKIGQVTFHGAATELQKFRRYL